MSYEQVEDHFLRQRNKYVKRMTFRAGTVEGAEDVVQEAYVRALKYIKSFNGENMDNWMNTIMNNCLREYKNQEKGYSGAEFDDEDAEAPCTEYPRSVMREVFELINTKSVDQMEVLNLYFQQEYSAKDISELTLHSYSKCHQIVQRFRNELKDLYK